MPEGLIPVFVFPNCLKFNLSDQSTHKQVLTLYNPYDFPVRFQVLCSSRDRHKYTVVDPEGKIQTHCCVDIVIRHNSLSNQNVGETDKFRIQMYQFATNKLIGKKDIVAELCAEETENQTPERESFQQLPTNTSAQPPAQYSLSKKQGPPNGLFISVAIICATILLLPTAGEISVIIPEYLKPTVHLKLVVSYVLGLVTMVLLRPA
ncbi:Motile sperm domain-containing protein, putative [Pediculus humanus corporis]|uniref:Motile sperm domain-containing protein, putative n=1 Tax=Pediculus humanus subsp. corporis TaxID=121224 RepID=E0VZB5_PEDHC|nr:Motile sperm domain-containing protein, putative [Pediculus humanus corporis]EEB18721.1 Motile sperm domain-containing protein, putative [Pediculus humanus corporis]